MLCSVCVIFDESVRPTQGWKPGYLALGCQFQFWCVETQMSGFGFGLVSPLLHNRFRFWFKFHPRKQFYFEYEIFKCSTSLHFCFDTMISCGSDGRVRRAISSEVIDLAEPAREQST